MGSIKYCPNCGHPLQEGARFCQECGTPVGNIGTELTVSQQSRQEIAPVHDQPLRQPAAALPNQQPHNVVIDITPLEERPQYKNAMKVKRSARNWFIATAIMGCIFIYHLCSPADSWWGSAVRNFNLLFWGVITFCLLIVSLKKWNRHKNLLDMSTSEYNQELQKIEQQKQVATQFLSGVAQGFVQGYIKEKMRK